MLRFKKLGIALGLGLAVTAGGLYGWHSGAAGRLATWTGQETLRITAAAGFRVNDILVTGRSRISADDLLASLNVAHGAPVFGINIDDAQKNIATIPWVKDVTVTRRLPDKIIVELTERDAVALWQYQRKLAIIDETGRVLSNRNLDDYQTLPLIVGEDAPQHVQELLSLLKAEPDIANQLVSAARIGGRRWDLRLKNDVTVKLPEENVELALRELASMAEKDSILEKNIKGIDLRIPEQAVVEPLPSPEAPKKTI
ncbi:MAG: FtsQ-type POTRA domain-containing protein [Micavibrio sp.]|nr:FtsQ-type POTRA domain-containing protein [Micavibrio sp.]